MNHVHAMHCVSILSEQVLTIYVLPLVVHRLDVRLGLP